MAVYKLLLRCQLKKAVCWNLLLLVYGSLVSRCHARRIILRSLLQLVKYDMLLVFRMLDSRVIALLAVDTRYTYRILLLLCVFVKCKFLNIVFDRLARVCYRRR